MAAVSFFWKTDVADVTCQNVLFLNLITVLQQDAKSECNSTTSFGTMENSQHCVVFNVWSEDFCWHDKAWFP